jgi:hypothetical protein
MAKRSSSQSEDASKKFKAGDVVDVLPTTGPGKSNEGGIARVESVSSQGIAVKVVCK